MSILDSTFPNGSLKTLEKKYHPNDGLLSLNDIIQQSLKKAQTQVDKAQLIVRCEALPRIKAEREEMVKLFDDLLSMILNCPPTTTRLFLYIDCEENATDVIDMTLSEGFKYYAVRFHTNITTHDHWKLVNSQALINCKQILSRHNGNLVVNDISSTGCVFSVSLPGKFE